MLIQQLHTKMVVDMLHMRADQYFFQFDILPDKQDFYPGDSIEMLLGHSCTEMTLTGMKSKVLVTQ